LRRAREDRDLRADRDLPEFPEREVSEFPEPASGERSLEERDESGEECSSEETRRERGGLRSGEVWVGRDVDWQWVHGRRVRPVPGGIEPVATSGWPQTFLRQVLGRDRLLESPASLGGGRGSPAGVYAPVPTPNALWRSVIVCCDLLQRPPHRHAFAVFAASGVAQRVTVNSPPHGWRTAYWPLP
jgi:hypothetical protein